MRRYVCAVIRQGDGRQIWEGQQWSRSHTHSNIALTHARTCTDPASAQTQVISWSRLVVRKMTEIRCLLLMFVFLIKSVTADIKGSCTQTCFFAQFVCPECWWAGMTWMSSCVQAPPIAYFPTAECKREKLHMRLQRRTHVGSPKCMWQQSCCHSCITDRALIISSTVVNLCQNNVKLFSETKVLSLHDLIIALHIIFLYFAARIDTHNSHPSIPAWPRFKFINKASELADTAITPSKINSCARG